MTVRDVVADILQLYYQPAPPLPVFGPLPNNAFANSLKDGSSSVFIKKKTIAKKNKSYFGKSFGDQASMPTPKKGVISCEVGGKAYFKNWSNNVKVEGKNVCRNTDPMTHDHK